jgi:hypothetical protein
MQMPRKLSRKALQSEPGAGFTHHTSGTLLTIGQCRECVVKVELRAVRVGTMHITTTGVHSLTVIV